MKNSPWLCFLLCVFFSAVGHAQQKWDLRQCIDYALNNNISVKQQDVQARITQLQYNQSKLSQYPSASFSANTGYSSGRNQNPVTFDLITQGYLFSQYNLQASVELFNWFSKLNEVASNQLQYQAALASVDKLKNDIALNVAGAYLQVLLAREQIKVSEIQVGQTTAQLENTRKLVRAGNLPELNAVQLEAQLANDSSVLVSVQGNARQALLNLKALLSLDASAPFDITTPNINSIPLDDLASLQPDAVYALAVKNLPQQRVNELRIKASEKAIASAKGARYPSIGVFGSLGSSYNNRAQEVTGLSTFIAPVGKVTVGGTQYDVFPNQPFINYNYGRIPYFNQLDQNFRQSVGLSLSVPIANGGVLRTNYERSKLNLKNYQLQKQADDLTLKQDIYKAYNDVITSTAKYNATIKQTEAAQRAFDFATKRYGVGLLNTIDLITTQNNLFSAQLQRLLAQYDFVFKMKVLEFYKGQGLRL
ncbi:MAG: TolC family protein [Chitinophagaceae bacterium]